MSTIHAPLPLIFHITGTYENVETHLVGVADATIGSRSDHGADKVEATNSARSIEAILRRDLDGETVRMAHFGRQIVAVFRAAIDVRTIGRPKNGHVRHVVINELPPLHHHVSVADQRMVFIVTQSAAQHPHVGQEVAVVRNLLGPHTCALRRTHALRGSRLIRKEKYKFVVQLNMRLGS